MNGLRPVLLLSLLSSCALTQLQTARTTPAGVNRFTMGGTYTTNANSQARAVDANSFPAHLSMRRGLTDNVDVGGTILFGRGLMLDAKWNLAPPGDAFALAFQVGAGGTVPLSFLLWQPEYQAWVLRGSFDLLVSYGRGPVTPYGGIGISSLWVFGRQPFQDEKGASYSARSGSGDGLLKLTVGVEWQVWGTIALLAEYSLLQPTWDDPGDFYQLVDTHVLAAGLRF